MSLTTNAVKSAKSGARNYKMADSKGLQLLITTGEGKSGDGMSGRAEGQLLTLGRFPDVDLAGARGAASDVRFLLARARIADD